MADAAGPGETGRWGEAELLEERRGGDWKVKTGEEPEGESGEKDGEDTGEESVEAVR